MVLLGLSFKTYFKYFILNGFAISCFKTLLSIKKQILNGFEMPKKQTSK